MDAEEYSRNVNMDAPDESQALALKLIGHNQRVLEFGCAAGHVTRALNDRGCSVVGLEIDPAAAEIAARYAEEVIVLDLDSDDYATKFEGREFDVALFGDVLEHLRDPLRALRGVRHVLAPSCGFVVLSIPNIAHVDVRLALLQGRFDYRPWGLLDEAHLRFFTRASIEQLLEEAGLVPIEMLRVVRPVFASELGVQPDEIDAGVLAAVLQDPEAETYQFVIKAVPNDAAAAVGELGRRVVDLEDRLRKATIDQAVQLAAAERRSEVAEQQLEALRDVAETAQVQSAHATAELAALRGTRVFRWTAPARRVYGTFRRRRTER